MAGIKIANDAVICITHKGEDIYLPASIVLFAADFFRSQYSVPKNQDTAPDYSVPPPRISF